MKPSMVSIRNNVPQQRSMIDLRPHVVDLDRTPIRLPSHRTIRLQKIGEQGLFGRRLVKRSLEQRSIRQINIGIQIEPIQRSPFKLIHRELRKFRRRIKMQRNGSLTRSGNIALDRVANRLDGIERSLRERAQIQLE